MSIEPAELPRTVLLLHADDFGFSRHVTDGIARAFRHGLLTSTSVLANAPDFRRAITCWHELRAAQQSRDLPSWQVRVALGDPGTPFDLGVHLNLTQGQPLTGRSYPRSLLDHQECFPGIGRLFAALSLGGRRHRRVIVDELSAQIERVLEAGAEVVHLNGHQYVELIPVVGDAVVELADRFRIGVVRLARDPSVGRMQFAAGVGLAACLLGAVKQAFVTALAKKLHQAGLASPRACFGTVHAGKIDLAASKRFLATNAATMNHCRNLGDGSQACIEFIFHPALAINAGPDGSKSGPWHDPLAHLRPHECDLLTSHSLFSLLRESGARLGRMRQVA